MSYKLIAIDIDGTLLNNHRLVTPRTGRAIQSAVAAGVRVVLCTGRSLHSARHIAAQVDPAVHLILHSGALILDRLDGTVLRATNLPRDVAIALIVFLKDEGYDPLVYDPVPESRSFLHEPQRTPNEWLRRYIEANGDRARLVPDLLSVVTYDPAQLAAAGRRENIDRLRARLVERWPGVGLILSRSTLVSDYWFIEIVPPEVSKSTALAFLGDRYGIRPSEMVAVGDNFNDLDMIEFAGLGVAMENAPDEVKAAADFVARSNHDDGVAQVIEEFILPAV